MVEKTPAQIQRTERIAEQRAIARAIERRPAFNRKILRWIDHMVVDGMDLSEAARAVGIPIRRARFMWTTPRVLKAMQERAVAVRSAETTRNPAFLARVRDRGFDPAASAAQQKASIEAAKALEGQSDGPRVNVSIHGNAPGLIIDLGQYSPPPPQPERPTLPAIKSRMWYEPDPNED